jgi:hypothetical protein
LIYQPGSRKQAVSSLAQFNGEDIPGAPTKAQVMQQAADDAFQAMMKD